MPIRPRRTAPRRLVTSVLAAMVTSALTAGAMAASTAAHAVSIPAYADGAVDEPDTVAVARSQHAVDTGVWLRGTLHSDHDSDLRRIRLPATSTVVVTLGGLLDDYRLSLHRADGAILARGNQPGAGFEQLAPRLPAGEYFVRVAAARPGVRAAAYQLMVRVLPDRTVALDSHRRTTSHLTVVTGQLVNNAQSWQRRPVVTARFYDRRGELVGTATALAERTLLAPGERAAFRIVGPPLPEAVRHVVRVRSEWTAPQADRPTLTASSDLPYELDDGRVRHVGRVTATGGPVTGAVHVHVLRYNASGALVDFGHAILAVRPGRPVHYEVDLPTYRYSTTTRVTLSEG